VLKNCVVVPAPPLLGLQTRLGRLVSDVSDMLLGFDHRQWEPGCAWMIPFNCQPATSSRVAKLRLDRIGNS